MKIGNEDTTKGSEIIGKTETKKQGVLRVHFLIPKRQTKNVGKLIYITNTLIA